MSKTRVKCYTQIVLLLSQRQLSNIISLISGTLPPQPNGSLRSHGHVLRHMSGRRINMNRRGSSTKRHSKEGLRPPVNHSRNQDGMTTQVKSNDEGKINLSNCKNEIEKKVHCGSDPKEIKLQEGSPTPPKVLPSCRISSHSPETNQKRKLSLSQSESSLVTLGKQASSTNLNWFKPVITGSLEFSKTSLCLPSNVKDQKLNNSNTSDGVKTNLISKSPKGNATLMCLLLKKGLNR